MSGVVVDDVDIDKIARSGQCFLIDPCEDGRWLVTAGTHRVAVEQLPGCACRLQCTDDEFAAVWRRYFDLEYD